CVGLQEKRGGPAFPYQDGTYTRTIDTNYFQIQWLPTLLEYSEISSNQDNCFIDIQVSHTNNEFDCPDGYSLVSSDDEHWCYSIIWPLPPAQGFTFAEAFYRCDSSGDSLPILTTDEVSDS
ncbi:hypothetical protein PMAYCL1PPCAC_19498, partial [Pristionchus mayeri]